MYKIAIVGASTLLGKELKEALEGSPLAASAILLMDEEDAQGQLDQVGDEATFVQAIGPDALDHVDFTFFCGAEAQTQKHWRDALRAGSTVLDLSGALDQQAGVLIRAPWVDQKALSADLFTPAIVPAHPAALALALLVGRLQESSSIRMAAATLLLPASEFGRGAMDELHQQTVSLLSFQSLPRAIYDAQAAYNLLSGLGESATASVKSVEARVRRHYAAMAGQRWPSMTLQAIHAPVFHGHTFSILVDLEYPATITGLEEAIGGDHLDLVLEDTDSPSNLAATGQNDVLVRMRAEPSTHNSAETQRLWLWAASDNLRLFAQNAVECAMELRRLRPKGSVQ